MKEKIEKIVNALNKAKNAANEFADSEDGGSCNFDSCVIKLPRWTEDDIKEIEKQSGVSIGSQLSSRWYKGYRFINIGNGQANRKTRMAEAAKKSLKADGYDVSMYYAMD
ncbi:hypothetical protein M0Q97_09910 [Candidatus Dojkabacteria bacterium]|jgi:hypothetical protein|nr:hypothetical protein [Candidatus Dojkabacteria bacterium]